MAQGRFRAAPFPMLLLLAASLAAATLTAVAAEWTPREGKELIGTPAPEWRNIRWIQGGPLTLAGLRGRVVLLRFWLSGCPYCERTAPALRELDAEYRDRGLVVVGLHHAKSEESADPVRVLAETRKLGFSFPVGMDEGWSTLRAYGVGSHFHRYTSLSFLIDPSGVIRWVHDGGEYHPGGGEEHRECNAAYEALRKRIDGLLPKTSPGSPE